MGYQAIMLQPINVMKFLHVFAMPEPACQFALSHPLGGGDIISLVELVLRSYILEQSFRFQREVMMSSSAKQRPFVMGCIMSVISHADIGMI